MDSWRDWLPEAAVGTGVTTAAGIGLRLLGHQPLRSTVRTIAAIKNALFDLGNLWIDNESLRADVRALEEALARANARNAPRSHPDSSDSPPGSTATPAATSASGPNARQQTRILSRRSVRRKRGASPGAPTNP
jgi:hypothetical protein